uniref:Uncharacterized protein n=1 Tax=Anguilla anguilla TaxID=7936 RepID=A0A0E9VQG7_ANGAN
MRTNCNFAFDPTKWLGHSILNWGHCNFIHSLLSINIKG